MRYIAWLSHTCWVCTGGRVNKPRLHVRKKYTETSPCDTEPIVIDAPDRKTALKEARKHFRNRI